MRPNRLNLTSGGRPRTSLVQSEPSRWQDPIWRGLAIALGLAVVVLIVTLRSAIVWDDPAILFRYAVNLANGHGWTFNPGQRTDNAVTSPLTVLVLAAMLRVGAALGRNNQVDLVQAAATVVFFVGTWTASLFTYLAFRRSGRELGGFVSGAFVATSPIIIGMRGMESAGYLAFVSVALWAAMGQQPVVLGMALGCCVLARPDSIVFAVVLIVWIGRRNRRLALRATGLVAALAGTWLGTSQLLTGKFLPSTLDAKIAQAQSGAWPTDFHDFIHFLSSNASPVWSFLVLPLVLLGAWLAARHHVHLIAPLSVGAAALLLIYGVLGVASYPWHMVLQYYLGLLLAGLAVDGLLTRRSDRRAALLNGLVAGYVLAVVATGLGEVPHVSPERKEVPLVAKWLDRNSSPDSTVAAWEVGRLGLLSNRRMVDYLGLLSSRADDHVRRDDWTWWPRAYQPDYWVTYRNLLWDPETKVTTMSWFHTVFTPVYETQHLVIYRRQAPVPR